jgi:hypothetical protein
MTNKKHRRCPELLMTMSLHEPEIMKMPRRIRADIHEEIKDLSPRERVNKIREEADACKKEYGITLPRKIKVRQ